MIAAICACPSVVLYPLGLLKDVAEVTGYPSLNIDRPMNKKTVCYSHNVLTSQGPGTAIPFSLRIIELLLSQEKAHEISRQIIF